MTAHNGRQAAYLAKRTRCQRCNGKGRYLAASGSVVDCRACDGSGRVVPIDGADR